MASLKYVFWLLTTLTIFSIMAFFAIATVDPFYATVQSYSMGGMSGQVDRIHQTIVQYMIPIFIATAITVTVFYILREERQTVR